MKRASLGALKAYNAYEMARRYSHLPLSTDIITVRNEVAKVTFLHVSVILSTGGGVCLSACWDTTPHEQAPPGADTLTKSRPPPRADDPPKSNPPPRADPPPTRLLLGTERILLECILVIQVQWKGYHAK